jgi:hypothetical protein
MRGTAMQRTHSSSAGHGKTRSGGAYKSENDASEGIQLSSLASGGASSYATLSSSSAHGDGDEEGSGNGLPVYGSSRKELVPSKGPRSLGRSNSSVIPGVLSGIAALFPASLTGVNAVKLERAGSDEQLDRIGNPINSMSSRSNDYGCPQHGQAAHDLQRRGWRQRTRHE